MIGKLVTVTHVDVTTVTLRVEVVVRAPHEEAVVVGVEDTRLQADRGELAHLVRLGDLVAHVVAGRVCKHPENDKTADCGALGGQVSFLSDRPAFGEVSVLFHKSRM